MARELPMTEKEREGEREEVRLSVMVERSCVTLMESWKCGSKN